jgi:succinate-acetate transporter protein
VRDKYSSIIKEAVMKKILKKVFPRENGKRPDSAAAGWLAFGITVLLLSLHNIGLYSMNSMVMGTALSLGAAGLVISGILEWRKSDAFGATAFLVNGLFWFSFVASLVMSSLGWGRETEHSAMGFYVLTWGLFSVVMFVAAFRIDVSLQFFFGSLALMFILLGLNDFTGAAAFQYGAGVVGLVCGLSGIYAGLAGLLNAVYGRTVLPVCPSR